MVALKTYRLKKTAAFSLFESVVAVAVISVLIGIGTIVYSNLVAAERPIPFYQAKEEIDLYFQQLQDTEAFFSKVFDRETYTIEQQVDFHNGNKKLYEVVYIVKAQQKTWYTEKHVLANPYEVR